MKKVLGIARGVVRTLCVCILFPGVEVDIKNIYDYFSHPGDKEN